VGELAVSFERMVAALKTVRAVQRKPVPGRISGSRAVLSVSKPLPTSVPGVPPGFSAQLRGASLFDLIQFEASSRGRRVVRVTSEGRSALLTSTTAGSSTLRRAADRRGGGREMLGWGKGTFARFDHFDGPWPKFETVGPAPRASSCAPPRPWTRAPATWWRCPAARSRGVIHRPPRRPGRGDRCGCRPTAS
jgi:hypothetical protein